MKRFFTVLCVLMGALTISFAQRAITGNIKDVAGEPLIGANIIVQGTSIGAISDLDGNFELSVPNDATILVASYTGYTSKEVALGTSNVISIILEAGQLLDEIVVVGYGTQIKSRLTGNIAKVSGADIQNAPVVSLEGALQGKAAGVFIEATNGKAGGASRMRIRGASSINASNQPLYVIDGLPMSTESLNSLGGATNPIADINPNDIESIEILKDASAAAIYGSRGANGVVIITTKKGGKDGSKINFNVQYGSSNPTRLREFMNTEEFLSHFREAAANSDAIEEDGWAAFVESRFLRYSGHAGERVDGQFRFKADEGTIDTDWQREAFKTAPTLMADISATGGSETLKYFASASYNNQDGIIVGNNFERFSGRLNVDSKLNSWIDLGLNMSLSRSFIGQVTADNAFSTPIQLVALAPITPIRNKEGALYDTPVSTYYNGLIDVEDALRNLVNNRTIANGVLSFKLTEGLKWRNELGFDLFNLKENGYWTPRTETGRSTNGSGFANYGETQNIVGKSYLTYDKTFGKLGLNAVAGTELQKTDIDRADVTGVEFPTEDLKTIASAAEIQGGTSTFSNFSFVSYFSRFNFDYLGKYLFTIAGRVDGSSRFGENNRYGFFPATSVGYLLSEESFLKDSELISFLKLRASYGRTGNAAISNFGHLGLYGSGTYNNQPGLRPTQIANPDLQWEKTDQIDVGIDFGFLNNRISGEIDYYNKNTSDLLLQVPVPGTSGFSTQLRNIGAVRNRGVEFVLNTNNVTGKFTWNTSFNVAFNRNVVTNLGDQDLIDEGSSRFMNVVKVGEQLGAFYGAEYAGVDPQNGDAIWYKNTEENPRETTNDYNEAEFVVLGNPTPDWIGGLTNTFSYQGIDLGFTFQGVLGNQIHLTGDAFMACNGCWFDNQTKDQLNSWKKPGDITQVPQARLGYSNGDQARSSRYISDGTYLRLRNLSVGYTIPKSVLSKVNIDKIRVYLQGQNLLTFTDYIGWDPEVSADFAVSNIRSGIDFYSAPQPKTVTFGLNVTF
jgi:TonB-dependent starch-binding outer membrane protein SusC